MEIDGGMGMRTDGCAGGIATGWDLSHRAEQR
jgi:hypothetical protein